MSCEGLQGVKLLYDRPKVYFGLNYIIFFCVLDFYFYAILSLFKGKNMHDEALEMLQKMWIQKKRMDAKDPALVRGDQTFWLSSLQKIGNLLINGFAWLWQHWWMIFARKHEDWCIVQS